MTTQPPNLLQLAQQGDPRAIAALMNRNLQPKGITAKVGLKDGYLQVLLESAQVPDQQALVGFVQKGIRNLQIPSVKRLRVYGKQVKQEIPAWTQEIVLDVETVKPLESLNSEPETTRSLTTPEKSSNGSIPKVSTISNQALPEKPTKPKLRWFETDSPILIIGLLILFFPLGLWSMWKYAKWSPKTKWIITGVIASLVLLSTLNRREETLQTVTTKPSEVSSAQSSTQPTEVKCDLASGYIWTNVLLYRDSECTKPFAIVAGGGKLTTGEKGVLLKFDTGELEWKKREAVTQQAYVKTNDPAIKTMLWRDIDQ